MVKMDLPDIYTLALGPAALRPRRIYQANPDCPLYFIILHCTSIHVSNKLTKCLETHNHN